MVSLGLLQQLLAHETGYKVQLAVTMRPSTNTMAAVARILLERRDKIHTEWSDWIAKRLRSAPHVRRETIERQLDLILEILTELTGSLRREGNGLWLSTSEWYGRTAALRGLAAGEVVEEFQYLRELLIRHLSELATSLVPRQSMAAALRLNRLLDTATAHAVVGYTDALVESLLETQGIPLGAHETEESEVEDRLAQLERELAQLKELND